jgi:hypothetical protein
MTMKPSTVRRQSYVIYRPIELLSEKARARRLSELARHGWPLEGYDRKLIANILEEWVGVLTDEEEEDEDEIATAQRLVQLVKHDWPPEYNGPEETESEERDRKLIANILEEWYGILKDEKEGDA